MYGTRYSPLKAGLKKNLGSRNPGPYQNKEGKKKTRRIFIIKAHVVDQSVWTGKIRINIPDPTFELVLRSRSRGAEIKLPSGAGAEITNCDSGSFLPIYQNLRRSFIEKNHDL
jgi:hypothetical protein